MKVTFNHSAVTQIVLAFALATFVNIQQTAMAGIGSGEGASSPSASEALRGALDNVRHRYDQILDYYGLTELCYVGRRDVCSLDLDMPGRAAPLHILYDRADKSIQYPQVMTKGVAQQLIGDRMLIDSYQKVLRADEINSTTTTRVEREYQKDFDPKQIEEFQEYYDEARRKGESSATIVEGFKNKTGLKRREVRNLFARTVGLSNLSEEEREEVMKSPDVQNMTAMQNMEKRKAEYKKAGAERAKSITREEAVEAFGGRTYMAEAFWGLKERRAKGEELNKHEQAAYDKYTETIGRYVLKAGGRLISRGARKNRGHIVPRKNRYEDDQNIEQWQKAWIDQSEKIKADLNHPSPKVGRTVRGQELNKQRARQNSKGEISITGNRRGKLTLTGK